MTPRRALEILFELRDNYITDVVPEDVAWSFHHVDDFIPDFDDMANWLIEFAETLKRPDFQTYWENYVDGDTEGCERRNHCKRCNCGPTVQHGDQV